MAAGCTAASLCDASLGQAKPTYAFPTCLGRTLVKGAQWKGCKYTIPLGLKQHPLEATFDDARNLSLVVYPIISRLFRTIPGGYSSRISKPSTGFFLVKEKKSQETPPAKLASTPLRCFSRGVGQPDFVHQ